MESKGRNPLTPSRQMRLKLSPFYKRFACPPNLKNKSCTGFRKNLADSLVADSRSQTNRERNGQTDGLLHITLSFSLPKESFANSSYTQFGKSAWHGNQDKSD